MVYFQSISSKPDYDTSRIRPSVVKPTKVFKPASTVVTIFDNLFTASSTESTKTSKTVHLEPSTTEILIPTKYITHTKYLTTKTTIVKSLGAPAITLTLVVTKTETSTILDTITQTHTLLKPTSVFETVTTTINHTPTVKVVESTRYPSFSQDDDIPTIHGKITESEDDLEEFIIKDDDVPKVNESRRPTRPTLQDNESIFVVMTDKKQGGVIKMEGSAEKVEPHEFDHAADRDEIPEDNEVNRVLLGGILIASPPSLDTPGTNMAEECRPDCKATRNELCQRVDGMMKCVCRPGFARMFPDRPCKPTYTYKLKVNLTHLGKERLRYDPLLEDSGTGEYTRLAKAAHEGVDRMVMQSDLRDIYHGVQVKGFHPPDKPNPGVTSELYLQLSDNTDEVRLKEVFKKYLRNNNFSLGGTDLYAAGTGGNGPEGLSAEDFDECDDIKFHDCSEHAQCFNLKGTYTCSCREGFTDLSENPLFPGRVCSAELIGCERCHYHGTCYSRGDGEKLLCECFQWYAGESCHINLKVLLIALVTLGAILITLLLVCLIMSCVRRRPHAHAAAMGFMPHRPPIPGQRPRSRSRPRPRHVDTIDKRAMIQDSSSEASDVPPYVPPKLKGALKKPIDTPDSTYIEQRDRSLTVMIPRAKYHPPPPTSPLLNAPASFDKRKASVASSNETKLLSYLDAGPTPVKDHVRRKPSSDTGSKSGRRVSAGALVSAGFEVSATVGSAPTICGTEADRSENATLIHKISADLLSTADSHSQFTTLRKRCGMIWQFDWC